MAQRPQGCKAVVMTADGYVLNAANKSVYAVVISCLGATAGDVIVLRDGGPEGTIKLHVIVNSANSTIPIELGRYGINFVKSIYYSELVTAAEKVRTTVVYD